MWLSVYVNTENQNCVYAHLSHSCHTNKPHRRNGALGRRGVCTEDLAAVALLPYLLQRAMRRPPLGTLALLVCVSAAPAPNISVRTRMKRPAERGLESSSAALPAWTRASVDAFTGRPGPGVMRRSPARKVILTPAFGGGRSLPDDRPPRIHRQGICPTRAREVLRASPLRWGQRGNTLTLTAQWQTHIAAVK